MKKPTLNEQLADYKALYDKNATLIFNYVKKSTGSTLDAEDIVQELFVDLWSKKGKVSFRERDLRPYLFRMARNKIIDLYRKREVEKRHTDNFGKTANRSSSQAESMEHVEYKELKESVDLLIAQLPPQCKDVFLMSRIGGMSYAEIGELLGISTKTVENHIGKALKRLKKGLPKYVLASVVLIAVAIKLSVIYERFIKSL
ncbi:RNA polymerase sigma-70 factor [Fulvitalea axinellae]